MRSRRNVPKASKLYYKEGCVEHQRRFPKLVKTCKWKRIASPTPHIEGNVEEGIENEESERKGSRFTVALCR